MTYHSPVLLSESIKALHIKPQGKYIDATLGGGGHTQKILQAGGSVLGIDCDQDAIDYVAKHLASPRLTLVHGNFRHLTTIATTHKFAPVDGILLDLGVSSWQLTHPERGFSLHASAPLDMRMDQDLTVTAQDLLAAGGQKELARLFTKYSDEPRAAQIARKIIQVRSHSPITTTAQLTNLIESIYKTHKIHHIHPATKVFQALRIAVNDELTSLELALPQAISLLKPGGRLITISFHSGEDRLVKHFFLDQATTNHIQIITPKPITANSQELSINPRARSAKLRIAQKT